MSEIGAAIDIGSNSVHLLVGIVEPDGVRPILDQSALLGLGDVVDRDGHLTSEARERLMATLAEYAELARTYHATNVTLLGTEPLRRASNRSVVQSDVLRATGLPLHLLSHESEALLTVLGVTGGKAQAGTVLIVDIGGGSSEMILAGGGTDPVVGVLPTGSARLTTMLVEHDPPTWFEINALRAEAGRLVAALPTGTPARCVMVGGTSSNLIRLSPEARDRHALGRADVTAAYALLAREPAATIVERFAVNRRRAGQLAAGAALVEAFMDRYELDSVEVSQASLREGAILAVARGGDTWAERITDLALG